MISWSFVCEMFHEIAKRQMLTSIKRSMQHKVPMNVVRHANLSGTACLLIDVSECCFSPPNPYSVLGTTRITLWRRRQAERYCLLKRPFLLHRPKLLKQYLEDKLPFWSPNAIGVTDAQSTVTANSNSLVAPYRGPVISVTRFVVRCWLTYLTSCRNVAPDMSRTVAIDVSRVLSQR